jgi:CRP/FNR family transcriptional regulator, cyclic AMP receptor protein
VQFVNYCKQFPTRSFEAGEIILHEGEQTGMLYVMIHGRVEVTRQGILLNKVSEHGAIFGEIAAFLGKPHVATVKALEHTRFYAIPDASSFLQSNPDVAFLLGGMLAQRMTSITSYLTSLKQSLDTLMQAEVQQKVTLSTREQTSTHTNSQQTLPVMSGVLRCGVIEKQQPVYLPVRAVTSGH